MVYVEPPNKWESSGPCWPQLMGLFGWENNEMVWSHRATSRLLKDNWSHLWCPEGLDVAMLVASRFKHRVLSIPTQWTSGDNDPQLTIYDILCLVYYIICCIYIYILYIHYTWFVVPCSTTSIPGFCRFFFASSISPPGAFSFDSTRSTWAYKIRPAKVARGIGNSMKTDTTNLDGFVPLRILDPTCFKCWWLLKMSWRCQENVWFCVIPCSWIGPNVVVKQVYMLHSS